MKPEDHPEFFRFPAPEGRSRESSIVLDEQGRFFHEAQLVERPAMTEAFFRWLRRHPDDGRYILSNGYDWTYVSVRGAPFFVLSVRTDDEGVHLRLSDGSEETLTSCGLRIDPEDALFCRVKNGEFEARFTRAAQLSLEPVLVEGATGQVCLQLGDELAQIAAPSPSAEPAK